MKFILSFGLVFGMWGVGAWAQDTTAGVVERKPWQETLEQVRALKAQRGQILSSLNKVAGEKRGLKEGSPQLKAKLAEYAKLYKEYHEVSRDYNQYLSILKYRYPDRLAKDPIRHYQPVEIETEAELGRKLDLDQRLSSALKKTRKVFSEPEAGTPVEAPRAPAQAPEGPTTIREEEPILLSK